MSGNAVYWRLGVVRHGYCSCVIGDLLCTQSSYVIDTCVINAVLLLFSGPTGDVITGTQMQ